MQGEGAGQVVLPSKVRPRCHPTQDRAGTGINDKELKRLAGVLKPLAVPKMPLAEPPPRDSRFGSLLKLWRVPWVRPELVVELTYLTWTEDNLLRQVSYQGQREDKPASQVVRAVPDGLMRQATVAPRAGCYQPGSLSGRPRAARTCFDDRRALHVFRSVLISTAPTLCH